MWPPPLKWTQATWVRQRTANANALGVARPQSLRARNSSQPLRWFKDVCCTPRCAIFAVSFSQNRVVCGTCLLSRYNWNLQCKTFQRDCKQAYQRLEWISVLVKSNSFVSLALSSGRTRYWLWTRPLRMLTRGTRLCFEFFAAVISWADHRSIVLCSKLSRAFNRQMTVHLCLLCRPTCSELTGFGKLVSFAELMVSYNRRSDRSSRIAQFWR